MNRDFIKGYKQGYAEGKKLANYCLDTDIKYIAGNISLILNEKGMGKDEIVEILQDMQKRWEEGVMSAEDICQKVYDELDIDIRVL